MSLKDKLVEVLTQYIGYLGKKQVPKLVEELLVIVSAEEQRAVSETKKPAVLEPTASTITSPKGTKAIISAPNV